MTVNEYTIIAGYIGFGCLAMCFGALMAVAVMVFVRVYVVSPRLELQKILERNKAILWRWGHSIPRQPLAVKMMLWEGSYNINQGDQKVEWL